MGFLKTIKNILSYVDTVALIRIILYLTIQLYVTETFALIYIPCHEFQVPLAEKNV